MAKARPVRMRRPPLTVLFALATVSLAAGCEELAFGEEPAEPSAETTAGEPTEEPDPEPEPEHHARVDARPPPLVHPVPLFE